MRTPTRTSPRQLAAVGLTSLAIVLAACGGATTAPAASAAPAAKSPLAPSAAPAAPTQASVPGQKEITLIKTPQPYLVDLVAAATKGDFAAARKAIKAYNTAWNGVEVYVSYRYPDMYTEVEAVREAKVTSLLDATPPNQAEVVKAAQSLLDEYNLIIGKISAGAPPISPLFDDIADLRILRTNTIRDATPALAAGDIATAKPLLQTFLDKWDNVEDLIKVRSNDIYSEIEAAMSKVNSSLQKTSPTAAELTPLVAALSNRFNYGISLVNAAARGADMSKKTYTTDDVQVAAGLVTINNALKTSLTAWQAGKYPDALASAQQASGPLFAKVAAPLKAKNGADAAALKALNDYAGLAGKTGDATTVSNSQKVAVEAVLVAQQWIVGQFWTDSKLKDAISAAVTK